MINLLPPEIKNSYSFAKRNTELLRWCVIFLAASGGIFLITLFGVIYMNRSSHSYAAQNILLQQDLKDNKLEETQKQIQDISGSLKLVVQVLSREVLFSKLINQIGSVIPRNAVLTDLEIINTQGAIDLTAVATNENAATQIQINLQDPANQLFDKADIQTINCSTKGSINKKYPCSISIRAQFAKKNPFLFINSGANK